MLVTFTLEEEEKWNEIVKSFEKFDVYYLPDYVKAFKLNGDGEPILFYYEYNGLRGINVAMKRDISYEDNFFEVIEKNKMFDLSTPYGYGGFIFEGNVNDENLKQFNIDYIRYCKKENIVSEFVRFHPVLNNAMNNKSLYNVTDLGKTVTINLTNQKEIWENFKSKNRNVIRKAIKSDVKIYWSNDIQLLNKFIPMYNNTMDKDNASDYYYFKEEFYESIIKDLKYNMMFFYAMIDDEIISMAMILMGNKQLHYHLSASNPKYNRLAPSNLLLTEAAFWGVENGFKTFHLGGGVGSQEDDLFKFKDAFTKGENTVFSIGKKIFDPKKYNYLLKLSEQESSRDEKLSFFPEYRN